MNDHSPFGIPGLSRRRFLRRFGLGFGGLALTELLSRDGFTPEGQAANLLAPQVASFAPRAKHVIFLFMQGGPSHLETFDPKPQMARYDGQLLPENFQAYDLAQVNTIDSQVMAPRFPFQKHGQSGLDISSLFPNIAKHADKLAVIRSCHHDLFIHGSALTIMNTGTRLLGHPSVGSWVTYGLGGESDRLPSYMVMTDHFIRNGAATYSSGFLPATHQGTFFSTDGVPIQNLGRPPGMDERSQRILLNKLNHWNDRHREARPGDSRLDARIANYELAFRMQSAAPELIDLSQETQQTRDLYGVDDKSSRKFGKLCLFGRRMVERGVRYVQLVSAGWDSHSQCEKQHLKQAEKTDRPIAGLLTDLAQRGLLDETLLVWAGEFGRTPIKQGNDGRDHHPYGFSVWMAGGGIRGGQVIGATDDFGFHAVEDKVHVNDLHATMLSLLGLDHEKLTYFFNGRDQRLTDVGGYNDLSDRLTA